MRLQELIIHITKKIAYCFLLSLLIITTAKAQENAADETVLQEAYKNILNTIPPDTRKFFERAPDNKIIPIFGVSYNKRRYAPDCTTTMEGGIAYYRNTGNQSVRGKGLLAFFPATDDSPALLLGRFGLSRLGTELLCYGITGIWKFGYWGPRLATSLDYSHITKRINDVLQDKLNLIVELEQPVTQTNNFYFSIAARYNLIMSSLTSGAPLDEQSLEALVKMLWRPYTRQEYELDTGYIIDFGTASGGNRRPGVEDYAGSITAYFNGFSPLGAEGSTGSQFGIDIEAVGRFGIGRQIASSTCYKDTAQIVRGYPVGYRLGDSCVGASAQLRFSGDPESLINDYIFVEYNNLLGFNYDAENYNERAIWYLSSLSLGLSARLGGFLDASVGVAWPLTELPGDSSFLDGTTAFFSLEYQHR